MGHWASKLWQRHNLRMEDFYNMPRKMRLLYVASEILEDEKPVRRDVTLLPEGYFKKR